MLMEFIVPYLPPAGTVAELGCGSGRLLARIGRERQHLKLIAIDYDSEALELAHKSANIAGVSVETRLGDVNCLKFDNDSFDMVVSGGLLEHFVDPRPVLAEMVRVLKPGGSFFGIVVPRKLFSFHRPLQRILGPKVYRSSYDANAYARWLEELGLSEVLPLSKGFYPPLFQRFPPSPRRAIERAFRRLDGTWLADRWGYFFIVAGRKRPVPHNRPAAIESTQGRIAR
jgi:ubiquinone/menaquinone biosynthesis C-methylase UbiE